MTREVDRERSYGGLLARLGLPTQRLGVWAHYRMPTAPHGWKLHLSSVQAEAEGLVQRVAPMLKHHEVPFKVAAEPWILGLLNEGLLGETQVGKFMTIYADVLPAEKQRELVDQLVEETRTFQGPRIVTDAHLGGVVYGRYGEFRPRKRRNRLGLFESDREDRELVRYRVPFEVPVGVEGADRFGIKSVEQASELAVIGPGFLPIGALATHPKGTVYLALDMRSQAAVKKVVLKQGRAGCMSDETGRDVRDRLGNHAAVEAALRGRVRTPVVEGYFHHQGDAYLALELIEGWDLRSLAGMAFRRRSKGAQAELLEALQAAAGEILQLHRCGFVHRDLSPSNVFLTPDGGACLMDLELAHPVKGTAPPFTQGTVGFVSPQQERNAEPSTSDDVFSFGAVMASLLSGFPGHMLPIGRADLGACLVRLSGANRNLCEIAAACLAPKPEDRPAMTQVCQVLKGARPGVEKQHVGVPSERAALWAAVEGGVQWLIHGASREPRTRLWLSSALESAHAHQGTPVVDQRLYRSANRGVSGVVYLLAKLWRHGFTRHEQVPEIVNHAVDWLLAHEDSPDDQMPGLHFGEAGVAVAICEAISAGLVEEGEWLDPYLGEVFRSKPDWPDLTHGAAGQGLAALRCGRLTGRDGVTGAADGYAGYLVDTQALDGSWFLPPGLEAMENRAFTGCAHGVAGMVYFLSCHALLRHSDGSLQAAQRGAEWLLDEARPTPSGNGLAWTLHPGTTETWNGWCHGAPGIALAFLALYRATGYDLYAGTARACLRSVPEDVRGGNLSQCHGLAGLGELLMEGYEVLGDLDLKERSLQLASAVADLAAPVEGGLAWRVESLYAREADLMTGGAGMVHFLSRAASGSRKVGMPLLLPADSFMGSRPCGVE